MRRARRPRRNVVILGTDGLESASKARYYRRAVESLGLAVATVPNERTIGVVPASDYRAVDAAFMCAARGIPGPDPLAATIATSKLLAYEFLRGRGILTLPCFVPLTEADFAIPFRRPVIVKPEQGAGSFAGHPWGYRVFKGLAGFAAFLRRRGMMRRFLDYQAYPLPNVGRYFAMEYVEVPWIRGIAAGIADRRISVYETNRFRPFPDSMVAESYLYERDAAAARKAMPFFEAFLELGLRRSVLYLQFVERAGRYYAIDFNLRPGTGVNMLIDRFRMPLYEQLLAFTLGLGRRVDARFPGPCLGVRRMQVRLRAGKRRASFPPGAIPLVEDVVYNPRKPWDVGYAFPMFALLCNGERDFERKTRAIMAATRLAAAR